METSYSVHSWVLRSVSMIIIAIFHLLLAPMVTLDGGEGGHKPVMYM